MVVATMHAGFASQATAASSAGAHARDIVPVGLKRLPAEGAELVRHGSMLLTSVTWPSICRLLRSTMATRFVERLVAGKHRGLPVLALLHLAVAEEHEDAAGVPAVALGVEAQAERHAGAHRAPGRASPCRPPRPGSVAVGVALQAAAHLAEREDLIVGDVAELHQKRVERGRRMTLGEHEAVALGVLGIGGVGGKQPPNRRASP